MNRFSSFFLPLCYSAFALLFVFFIISCASSAHKVDKLKADMDEKIETQKNYAQNDFDANTSQQNNTIEEKKSSSQDLSSIKTKTSTKNAPSTTSTSTNSVSAKTKKSYAELVLRSYAEAYPQKNLEVLFLDGEWLIRQKDNVKNTFYWADGRLLAKENFLNKDLYGKQQIYPYTGVPRNPALYTQEKIAELRKKGTKEALATEKQVDDSFICFLLDAKTRAMTERQITKTTFLGKRCNVHAIIVPLLKKINDEILDASKNSREISDFLQSIYDCGGYNWRTIDGTNARRSNHSYGIAVDITVKNNNKTTYWEWERVWNSNWMTVPQSRLWSPPRAVIEIFEKYNFVWGGTWDEYDTMHFEWRPELFLLQKYLTAQG